MSEERIILIWIGFAVIVLLGVGYMAHLSNEACRNSGGEVVVTGYQTVITYTTVGNVMVPQVNTYPVTECKHNGAK